MRGEQPLQPEGLEREGKEARYREMLKLAAEFNDPISKKKDEKDDKIIETVAILWALDIPTSQSCEGHLAQGKRPTPWVMIMASNEPKLRYINEQEKKEEIARKCNQSVEDIDWYSNSETAIEFMRWRNVNKETDEYKKWREAHRAVHSRIKSWLDEFYANREVPEDVKIKIEGPEDSYFEIIAGGRYSESEELTNEEKQALADLLPKRQEEMKAFTEFLKNKYLSN